MSNENKPVDTEEEQPSQEIAQGNEPVRPRRGRPRNPEVQGPNQVEALFQELIKGQVERPDAALCSEAELNDHNKRLVRQIQIILDEDFKMMSLKNIARIPTPNGIQKFEIGGLSSEQRSHLRETLKILVTTIKLFDDGSTGNSPKTVEDLAKQLYKGIPGLK